MSMGILTVVTVFWRTVAEWDEIVKMKQVFLSVVNLKKNNFLIGVPIFLLNRNKQNSSGKFKKKFLNFFIKRPIKGGVYFTDVWYFSKVHNALLFLQDGHWTASPVRQYLQHSFFSAKRHYWHRELWRFQPKMLIFLCSLLRAPIKKGST